MSTTLLAIPSTGTAGATSQQSYTEYTYTYTATMAKTWLTFEFRNDPSFWALDDISVTNAGGTNVIVNGGFETGTLSPWTLYDPSNLSNAGTVETGYAHTGTYSYVDGAVDGTDGISQGFSSVAGQTYTISFWLENTGSTTGVTSLGGTTNDALAEAIIGANVLGTNPLSISGAVAGQTLKDTGTITPFSGVTLTDSNTGAVDTVVVTSGTLNGTLSATVGGSVNNGTYTATGSLAAMQADLRALIFTPTQHQVAAGSTVQTSFTIALTDNVGAVPASNSTTSVIVTDTATSPTISGAVAGQTLMDTGTIAAFSSVTLADTNIGTQTETLTVTSATLNGALSDSVGGTVSGGTYTAIGSLSAVQADLQALIFTPTAHQVAPGSTVQTGFTIALLDTAGGTTSNSTTSVIVTAANNTPVITGATLGQTVTLDGNIAPFSSITITDPAEGATESVTIVLTDGGVATDADGTLAGTGLTHTAAGTYVLTTGTPAAVTSVLDSLQFSSTVSANATAVTVFTITDTTNHSTSGTVTASVTATDVGTPGSLALAAASDSGIVGDNTTDITTPMITGTGYAGDTITLYDGTVDVGSGTVASGGAWSVSAGTLATGTHHITATQTDPAGHVSATSSTLTVTVVPVPGTASGLTLSPASDSGTQGDNTTDITTPVITGIGSVGDTITLYDGTIAVGSGTVGSSGSWSITSGTLAVGTQTLTATQTDQYGDISAASTALAVTIVAVPNAPTGLGLSSATDSGVQGDDKTDNTTPTIIGTGTVGDIITLYNGTVDLGTGTVSAGGTWSIAAGTLAVGAHTLTATQTDTHGDISAASTLAVTILAPPGAPGTPTLSSGSDSGTQGDNSTDITTPVITGTGSVGDTITLYDGTIAVGTGTVNSSGTWSITTSTLATGTHDLTATQTDQYGDISAASSTLDLTIAAAPAAPAALALAPASDSGTQGDHITDVNTPTITGTGTAGDTIKLYDGTIVVGGGTVGSNGTWSITSGTLALGVAALSATQTDAAGDISPASGTLGVTIVAVPAAPASLTLSPASDSGTQGDDKTDDTTPTITGTGTIGDTVTLYDGTTSVGTGTVASTGTWSITTGTLATGVHPFTAKQADPYGDPSPSSGTLDVTIAAPPAAPGSPTLSPASDSGTQGDGVTDDTTPTLTGTGTPGDTIILYDGTLSVGSAVVGSSGTWSVTSSTLPVGNAMLSAVQEDSAGDISAASSTLDLTISPVPVAPGALTLAPASDTGTKGDDQTTDTTLTITGTGVAGDTVTLYDGATSVGSGTVASTGTWSVTSGTLTVGTHTLTATETDPYGDISPSSSTLDVTIQLPPAAPGTPTLSPSSDSGTKGDDVTDATRPMITGTGVAGETIALYDGTTEVGSATVGSSGIWAITTAPLADGLHPLVATQIDQYGNISANSPTLDLTIAPAPAAPGSPTLSPPSDSGTQGDGITDVTTPTITGTGTAGDTITLYDGATSVGSAVVNQAGTWSIVSGTLADGAHTLMATQTDPYGDISAFSSTLAVTIVAVPAAPADLTLAPASDSGVQGDDSTDITALTITGTGSAGDAVTLYNGVTAVGSGTVASDGSWSITTGTLAYGVQTFTATQADQYDDVSPSSGTLDVTIAAPPSAPGAITLSPASDSGVQGDGITDVTTPTLTGTGTPGDTITLYDGTIAVGSAVVGQDGAWSITSGSLGVGVAMLTATDTDAAGDVSSASATLDLTIVPVPAAPGNLGLSADTDSGVQGDDSTDDTTPTIVGTGTAGDTVVLYDAGTQIGTAVVGSTGTWSIAPGTLGLGVHPLTATESDQYGDVSPLSGTLDLTIAADPTAPGSLALSPASDSGIQGDGTTDVTTPTITGTGTAGDTITLYDGATSVGSGVVAQDGAWSIATSPLGVGMAVLTATDTDPAGDTSAPSGTLDVTIVSAPDAPATLTLSPKSDSGTPGDDATDDTTPTITGTGITGDTITLYDGATSVGSAVVDSTGAWAVTTGTLAVGQHPFTATQTDALGDISPASATLDVTITTVTAEPGAPTLSPSTDSGVQGDDITNVSTPDIIGTGVAGDTITLYDGTTSIGGAVVGQNGTWSINTGSLADGTHQLTDTQTDQYGDTSAAAGPLALTISSTAAAPTIMDEPAESTKPDQPVVGGEAADDGIVTIFQDGTAIGTVVASDTGAWSFDFPAALNDGTYAVTAMVQDVAGNISPLSGTVTVIVSDNGYETIDPPDSAGHVQTNYFDTDGAVTQVNTATTSGQLLQSVSNSEAVLEIYDGNGKLIGTVTQPSDSALNQPGFTTTGQGLAAVTNTSTIATVVNLLDEENIVYTHGYDTINAGPGSDTIIASGGSSTSVSGGTGNLVLVAGSGASMVNGGTGSATVFGGTGGSIQGGAAGNNVLVALAGTTTLVGGGSGDTYVDGGGNAMVLMHANGLAFGGTGISTVFGAGNDTMVGGSGSGTNIMVADATTGDEMFGGAGNTTMFGGAGNDTMVGGSGQTVMVLGAGNDVVAGGSGGTTVYGGGGNDLYFATGGGAMVINEGSGNNGVVLGGGVTTVTGGSGTDVYYVANGKAGGTDVINGFKVGTDQLRLFGYPSANATPTFSGGNAVFSLSDGTKITLVGVTSLAANSVA
jgi:acyl-coenzyme A thioesterase PaaI-like protein